MVQRGQARKRGCLVGGTHGVQNHQRDLLGVGGGGGYWASSEQGTEIIRFLEGMWCGLFFFVTRLAQQSRNSGGESIRGPGQTNSAAPVFWEIHREGSRKGGDQEKPVPIGLVPRVMVMGEEGFTKEELRGTRKT